MKPIQPNESIFVYMSEITSRVVAESGTPSDRFHLGKLLLQSMRDAPDFIQQIDGNTGKSESFGSVLKRSVRCANAFRMFGLQKDDVIFIAAPSHLDVVVPLYAALYLGIPVATADSASKVCEFHNAFNITKPSIVFCQSRKHEDVTAALKNLKMESLIVTFDENDSTLNLSQFIAKYDDGTTVENFRASNFNAEETIATLLPTSGTSSGSPKYSANTHKNYAISLPLDWSPFHQFPTPFKTTCALSNLHWVTAILNFIFTTILRITRLQTSLSPITSEHLQQLLIDYKPSYMFISPTFVSMFVTGRSDIHWDLSSLQLIAMGGSSVSPTVIQHVKKLAVNAYVTNSYGLTELSGSGLYYSKKPYSNGTQIGVFQYKIINIDTHEEIVVPNVTGELWVKSPTVFKGYYNNPEGTKEVFTEDGYFKTGDLFYRDEDWCYYFVERKTMVLKYRGSNISPTELENLIRQHPGVLDVAVTGIPDEECGDLITACVVPRKDGAVTAVEVKELVKNNLEDFKHLRGGVVFLDAIPLNRSYNKVNRSKLKELAINLPRE